MRSRSPAGLGSDGLGRTLLGGLGWAALLCVAQPLASAAPPNEAIVVLDPGHGGSNRGALGPDGAREKDITLALARRVVPLLEARPRVRVLLTRDADHHLSLRERAEMANVVSARLLLSIHCNSTLRVGPRGHEVLLLSAAGQRHPEHPGVLLEPLPVAEVSAEALLSAIRADLGAEGRQELSALAARTLHDALRRHLDSPARGLRQGPYDVLIHAGVPAVVAEVGFLNHPREGRRLLDADYQQRIAQALARGVLAYLDATDTAPNP